MKRWQNQSRAIIFQLARQSQLMFESDFAESPDAAIWMKSAGHLPNDALMLRGLDENSHVWAAAKSGPPGTKAESNPMKLGLDQVLA